MYMCVLCVWVSWMHECLYPLRSEAWGLPEGDSGAWAPVLCTNSVFFQLLSHHPSSASIFLIASFFPFTRSESLRGCSVVVLLLLLFCMILPSPLRCLFTPNSHEAFASKVRISWGFWWSCSGFPGHLSIIRACQVYLYICTYWIPFTLANLGPFCSLSETYSF